MIKQTFKTTKSSKGPVLIATVHGDIHDIGKNIVKVVLESYGYQVIDLGKDVPAEVVLEAYHKHHPKAIGLSALMTTTVVSMEETITLLKQEENMCPIFVGGAVLTEDIAQDIHADHYTKMPWLPSIYSMKLYIKRKFIENFLLLYDLKFVHKHKHHHKHDAHFHS